MAAVRILAAWAALLALAVSCRTGERPSCAPVAADTGYDFGNISLDDGPVSCTFAIANDGTEPFSVIYAVPSCGCVGVEVPASPVVPGDSALIQVTYSHKGLPSVFFHSVQVYLSNRVTPVVLSLGGTVHGSRRMLRKEFGPYATGDLGLREREYRSADLYRGFCVVELATVANLGRRPLEVGFTNVSDGLEISVTPNPVPPLCTAEMRMTVHSGPSVSGEITSRATPVLNGRVQNGGISVKTRIR